MREQVQHCPKEISGIQRNIVGTPDLLGAFPITTGRQLSKDRLPHSRNGIEAVVVHTELGRRLEMTYPIDFPERFGFVSPYPNTTLSSKGFALVSYFTPQESDASHLSSLMVQLMWKTPEDYMRSLKHQFRPSVIDGHYHYSYEFTNPNRMPEKGSELKRYGELVKQNEFSFLRLSHAPDGNVLLETVQVDGKVINKPFGLVLPTRDSINDQINRVKT